MMKSTFFVKKKNSKSGCVLETNQFLCADISLDKLKVILISFE